MNLTVNGPPTVTAQPRPASIRTRCSSSQSNGNAVTLADAAATTTSDSLTLTVTHGTLSLGSIAGLTFSAGSNGSASMTFTGTLCEFASRLERPHLRSENELLGCGLADGQGEGLRQRLQRDGHRRHYGRRSRVAADGDGGHADSDLGSRRAGPAGDNT